MAWTYIPRSLHLLNVLKYIITYCQIENEEIELDISLKSFVMLLKCCGFFPDEAKNAQ